MSGLLPMLETHCITPTGQPLCLYGDPAYPLRVHLQGPFKGAALTAQQQLFNLSMSKVRTAVEWVFGDILEYFSFLDFKRNLKVGLSAVGKMYIICALLRNAHSCTLLRLAVGKMYIICALLRNAHSCTLLRLVETNKGNQTSPAVSSGEERGLVSRTAA